MTGHVVTTTTNVEKSLSFYQKLGFSIESINQSTFATAENTIIQLVNTKSFRSGYKLYRKSWDQELMALDKYVVYIKIENGFVFEFPGGIWIYLMIGDSPCFELGSSHKLSVLGNDCGISIESIEIAKAISIAEILGFSITSGSIDSGWVSMKDKEDNVLSIMNGLSCPHTFYNPSISFFNGMKNIKIIEKIRSLDIDIAEEITVFNNKGDVDNVIIKDPGGLGFFIFSD